MSTILSKKPWHTLESAAHYLTKELNEYVTKDDIILFASQGDIRLSYRFFADDFKAKRISEEALKLDLENQPYEDFTRFIESQEGVYDEYIQGVFKFPKSAPYFENWLKREGFLPCYSGLLYVGYPAAPSYGLIIEDFDGIKYEVTGRSPFKKDLPDFSEGPDPYGDYDIKKSDLIVCRDDLERFISKTKEPHPQPTTAKAQKIGMPEERIIEAIGILALMYCESTGNYKWGSNPNAKALANRIKEVADINGFDLEHSSNLNKVISQGIEIVSEGIKR